MTTKVLPGASREALSFISQHWKTLAKISAFPFGLYMVLSFFQVKALSGFYRRMGTMMTGETIDPNFLSAYMRTMGFSLLSTLLGMCLLGILFVQIVRFHKSGSDDWFARDKQSLGAGVMTLLYGLGIGALTGLAYVAGVLVYVLALAILAMLFGESAAAGFIIGILLVGGIVGLVAGLYWFMFRFMAGLPGVALGHSPDFFKDMWPLTRGESWGLPLRMLLATLAAYVPMLLIIVAFGGSLMSDYIAVMSQTAGNDNPAVLFPLLADIMDRMMPLMALMMLAFLPFMWFMAVLLAIAFHRFRAKQNQAGK